MGATTAWGGDERLTATLKDHYSELVRLAVLVSADRQLGEDAAQDAILAASRAWAGVQIGSELPYLRTCVVRRAARLRGLRQREQVDTITMFQPSQVWELKDPTDQALLEALKRLGQRQRTVIVLKYCFDHSDTEISNLIDCSPGTVRSQASRGLRRLRNHLGVEDSQ